MQPEVAYGTDSNHWYSVGIGCENVMWPAPLRMPGGAVTAIVAVGPAQVYVAMIEH